MSNTPLVDKFIERYRRAAVFSADHALAMLIEQNAEHIEPLFEQRDPEWLHKAFRQTPVTESGKTDMVIWHLIHAAPSFWESLQDFWAVLEKRELKGRFNQLERQRDELLEERSRTGMAIDAAIRDGIVPDEHPLRSRLEMLANHRQREQALLAALEEARTGLAWYQEAYPEETNGSDDEAMARIDAAIASAKGK